ncbi:taurine dioxygenase [Altererythrobacter atlanticus]|uniref:Alpha-ketoglutarate-dependent taurine dioxygenase n=1 Tax=Croceibacterium atlanticum TaxID=1267766 RepID=A0A0F7KV45_9SPHN|nr:TauD/TfdA family dioxygenase [Croceibacterium atlanticum]AKH42630.1 Alpha-ketoglutarate-dependent taurine dioxygenase [Croceibacterium atlanticum]MBB5731407.1 taurine dioxygenase [Croceibacterium atlanticum]
MSYSQFSIDPVTPHMGAEISGLDLGQPLSDEAGEELRRALAEYLVIFFRDQRIGFEAHKDFARLFGDLHVAPATSAWSVPGHPEIARIHADGDSKFVAGEDWHSDMTCDPEPPLGSALHLHVVPPTGGDTAFSNMFAAYDALSDRMKAHLEGLSAVHDAALVFGKIAPAGTQFNKSSHPVIRTHPVSGRKAIFVNRQFTDHIEGIPKDESQALLAYLTAHVQKPEFQCRFRWQPYSMAFWDNRSVQHSAIWDYFPQTRSGYRVQVKGDRPV